MAKELVRHTGTALEAKSSKPGQALAKKASKDAGKKGPGHAAKKAAKHVGKKAAKHAARKETTRTLEIATVEWDRDELMAAAFHHLNRAAAVISLLEEETGDDLRLLLGTGVLRYEKAAGKDGRKSAEVAFGLLCAAEHLGMAGLFAARRKFVIEVTPVVHPEVAAKLRSLPARLKEVVKARDKSSERLLRMVEELARRAEASEDDPHLAYELAMAAHWICAGLERRLL